MFNFFKRKKIEVPIVSRYQKLVMDFQNIRTHEMKRVYSSDMTLLSFIPIKRDILSYISLLDQFSRSLDSCTPIGEYHFSGKEESILIRDFFVDPEGYTIDPIESTDRLIKSACQFINIYEKKESLAEENYTNERNLRLCYKVIVNLEFLSKLLIDITAPEVSIKRY